MPHLYILASFHNLSTDAQKQDVVRFKSYEIQSLREGILKMAITGPQTPNIHMWFELCGRGGLVLWMGAMQLRHFYQIMWRIMLRGSRIASGVCSKGVGEIISGSFTEWPREGQSRKPTGIGAVVLTWLGSWVWRQCVMKMNGYVPKFCPLGR